jgi:hypothetical protein
MDSLARVYSCYKPIAASSTGHSFDSFRGSLRGELNIARCSFFVTEMTNEKLLGKLGVKLEQVEGEHERRKIIQEIEILK